MSRTIEKTLTMLLPTATGGIPRELIDTTASLIAQSRHKLSNLKQAEEPAREMLCAHLACERLRTKLDLPVLPDRPPAPVPPKLYRTLYKQFSETLAISSTSRTSSAATTTSNATANANATASKVRSDGAVKRTPGRPPKAKSAFIRNMNTQTKAAAAKGSGKDKHIEEYIPLINQLCDNGDDGDENRPAMVRHVTAGTSYIFSSAKYRNLTETPYTLVGVVYVVVAKELMMGEKLEGEVGEERRKGWYEGMIAEVYKVLKKGGWVKGREAAWKEEFNEVLAEVMGEDMRETRWFMDLTSGKGVDVDVEEEEGEEGEEEVEEGEKVKGKRKAADAGMESGVGSMMQDRLDFLSDKRRRAFGEWKADALRRIAQIEA